METKTNQLLEDIKKLLVLSLAERNIKGKCIADALDVDPAVVSRILAPRNNKKKKKRSKK